MRPPATAGIAGDLRSPADALASHATVYRQVADSLEGAAPSLPESLRPQVTALAGRARAVASQADSHGREPADGRR